jgi:hypothetical protein
MFSRFKISHRHKTALRCVAIALCLVGSISLPRLVSLAQQVTAATIIEIRDGDQVFIAGKKARLRQVGQFDQQITTARAKAGLQLTERGGLRMLERSSFVVGSRCVRLFQGRVLISGQIGRNGCVGKVEVRSLGTVYVLEADGSDRGRIIVLEGTVEVSNPSNPNISPVTVGAGRGVETSAAGEISAPQQLSQAQLQSVAAPLLEGFQVPLPDLDRITILRNPGFATSFLQDALTGSDFDFDGLPVGNAEPLSGVPFDGVFTRTGTNTGSFTSPALSPVPINFTLDFDDRTITSFDPIPGVIGTVVEGSIGLSGDRASGTAIFQSGQIVRVTATGVNGDEPAVGQSFPGTLLISPRPISPGTGRVVPSVRDR